MSFIYLIKDNLSDLYKIGFSKDPRKRLKNLQSELTKLPLQFDFQLVGQWPCLNPPKIESFLHGVFEEDRVRGEWFNLENGPRGWGENTVKNFYEFMACTKTMEETSLCQ